MYKNSRPVSYGTTEELKEYYNSFNPPIPGELVYDSEKRRLVIGDGNKCYNLLPDINEEQIQSLINSSTIIIREDISSLTTNINSIEAGYRS